VGPLSLKGAPAIQNHTAVPAMIDANQNQPGSRQTAHKQGTQPREYYRRNRPSRVRTAAQRPIVELIASL
jgi:hypothetical protein